MSRRRTVPRAGGPLAWLGGVVVLYLAVPVVAFVVRLARTADPGFSQPGLLRSVWVSSAAASISVALIAVFGIPLAWVLARSRSRWARFVGGAVYLPLAVPPLMSGILLVYLVGPYTWLGRMFDGRLTDSLAGVVLAQTFVAAPFLIVAARSAFAGEDPAVDEVAVALGHRPLGRFFRVGLPGAAAGIRAGLLLSWLRAFGEYGATVLLAYHPSSLPVYTYRQFSASGLDTTVAPTALALVVAAAAVCLGWVRIPRRRGAAPAPLPRPPGASSPVAVAFDLDVTLGTFNLRAAHRCASHRTAILGPSGSGKSVMLRSLAGLLGPVAGLVRYGNDEVSDVPTEDRKVGYVPQGYHLVPHLDVWRQTRFGVGADPAAASYWLDVLGLGDLGGRLPEELSGGQRQRVCLAQALARSPRLLLLDEPFSALDSPVRSELAAELRRLQRRTGLSTVLVTHDAEEAALLADEILVLVEGRLVQAGSARQLHQRPASPVVARLLGMVNVLPGTWAGDGRVEAGGMVLQASPGPELGAALPLGSAVDWCVPPEAITIGSCGGHTAEVLDVADLGPAASVELRVAPSLILTARLPSAAVEPGDRVRIGIPADALTVWPRQQVGGGGAGPPVFSGSPAASSLAPGA